MKRSTVMLTLLLTASAARADEVGRVNLLVEGQVGLRAPFGEGGLGVGIQTLPWLDLVGGAGTSDGELQLGGMLRAHGSGATFGVGLTQGSAVFHPFLADTISYQQATRANFEAGFESRGAGLYSRVVFGLTRVLSAEGCQITDDGLFGDGGTRACSTASNPDAVHSLWPYLSVTVGYRY